MPAKVSKGRNVIMQKRTLMPWFRGRVRGYGRLGLKKNIVVSGNMDKKIGSVGRFFIYIFFIQWCL